MQSDTKEPGMLEPGHYLGLKYKQGWIFLHVLETEFIELKPWILMNTSDNRAAITAQSAGSQDDEIQDTLARRLIVPDQQEQNLFFQVRYGIAPSRMQVFPIFGRDRSPNLVGTAEPGEPYVPADGFGSPYNAPTEQTELITFNAQAFPSLQAFNPMSEDKEARLSFHVNKVHYAVIEDMGLKRAILQGQHPAKLHSAGLGAQDRDQIDVPEWLSKNFGSEINTTKEILSSGEEGSQSTIPSRVGE